MKKKLPTKRTLVANIDKYYRDKVLERDNYICQICHDNTNLHVHHFFRKRSHSAIRWDIDNLITLCHKCHFKVHNRGDEELARDALIKVIGKKRFEKMKSKAWDRFDMKISQLRKMVEELYD